MTFTFRVDASHQIGNGHIMRCLCLAQSLIPFAKRITFICAEAPGHMIPIIKSWNFDVLSFEPRTTPSGDQNANAYDWIFDAGKAQYLLGDFNKKTDWLVVDHYRLDERWERHLRPNCERIMVIDDLADRPHDCDLLLDQNFSLNSNRYDGLIPKNCVPLMGPRYALLRDEFKLSRRPARERSGEVERIVICFGGTDPMGLTEMAVDAIRNLKRPDIDVDVILGKNNTAQERLSELISEIGNVELHIGCNAMASLLSRADLCIGTIGISTWERCCLGLTSLVITVRKEQQRLARELDDAGVHILAGHADTITIDALTGLVAEVIAAPEKLREIGVRSRELVDGSGAMRVSAEMIAPAIRLRNAESDDSDSLFEWRNHEDIRLKSFDKKVVRKRDHEKWFKSTIANPNRHLLIGEFEGSAIGVLRYDVGPDNRAEVSIYIVPGHGHRGLGSKLIQTGNRWVANNLKSVDTIEARILPDNLASIKAFRNSGYTENYKVLTYEVHG